MMIARSTARNALTWVALAIIPMIFVGAFFTTGITQRVATLPGLGWLPISAGLIVDVACCTRRGRISDLLIEVIGNRGQSREAPGIS